MTMLLSIWQYKQGVNGYAKTILRFYFSEGDSREAKKIQIEKRLYGVIWVGM